MMKTLKNSLRTEREKFRIPHSVQQSIPVKRIYKDGVWIAGGKFSKCYRFTDINYIVASPDDQMDMFLNYCAVLNALDAEATFKITIVNRTINPTEFKDSILMQKQECREFATKQGWKIIKEISEKGVSGFKKSATERDAVIEIRKDASLGKFDILLVYMFDRLGRKEDETPFVVEWFVRNGIEVWSTQEGQQKFDNHTDKLMNYLRYWQASGESIKTSIRTKTRSAQLVQEGRCRGGPIPYGYRIEKQGRVNKKGQDVHELLINEEEAAVIRLIFEKYVTEGYGSLRISRLLFEKGILTRKGDNFTNTTINRFLKNDIYLGILTSGETKSEIFEELQIIDIDTFEQAQEIMRSRTQKHSDIPFNSKAKALLGGKVYCGHCGSKLVLTTSSGKCYGGDGTRETRLRYGCHYKVRHPQSCDGQSGYTASKLDELVEHTILILFARLRAIPQENLIKVRIERDYQLCQDNVVKLRALCQSKLKELESYKAEVYKAMQGQSAWSVELLNELIPETKNQLQDAERQLKTAEELLAQEKQASTLAKKQVGKLIGWAQLFGESSFDAKKMILSQLINKVVVNRSYHIQIHFNVSYQEFFEMLDQQDQESA